MGSEERSFVMRDTWETLDSNCHGPQSAAMSPVVQEEPSASSWEDGPHLGACP